MTTETRILPPALVQRLREVLGERLKLEVHERIVYGYDATGVSALPDAVVRVRSAADVATVLQAAAEWSMPVVARGAGSGLSAGAVPEHGGIVLSFEEMRDSISVSPERRRAWVQPGLVNASLEGMLAAHGLFYAPDPASHRVSTIGGNVAENSGGPKAVKYGVTGQHVSALEVVDMTGAIGILHAGELQNGPDLASLVIGSEGTLAVVTAVELKLLPRPTYVVTVLVPFEHMAGATAFVSRVIKSGVVPATLEFIDRRTIEAIEAWGVVRYPEGAGAVLLLELDGAREAVEHDLGRVHDLAATMGAMQVQYTDDPAERERLWLGRRSAFAAVGRFGKHILTQDITVPRERLTDMLEAVEEIGERYDLFVATVGHAGDGNLHPDFLFDPEDADESRRVHEANIDVMRACVAMGGSITGEHGIGSDKLHGLPIMYGPAELGLMADVKRALDPGTVLNPGKAIVMAPRVPPERIEDGTPEAAIQASVLHAIERGELQAISLEHCTGIHVDLGNLTVQIGAGETWDAVEEALADTPLRVPFDPLRERSVYRSLLLNDYGPEHLTTGTLRQHLLAITYVTGYGEVIRMGRDVVKNVAGYDLYRLLIGSRGEYGVPVRITVRLAQRDDSTWMCRVWRPDEGGAPLASLRAGFALPTGESFMLYGRMSGSAPEGWHEAPDGAAILDGVREQLLSSSDLLDLHLEPSALPVLLAHLHPPVCVLPCAARVLCRVHRESAEMLVERINHRDRRVTRAEWGRAWRPLVPADGLAKDWSLRLRQDVFAGHMLRNWFEREMRA
jgi:glycolate oxidase subunit GlcD